MLEVPQYVWYLLMFVMGYCTRMAVMAVAG